MVVVIDKRAIMGDYYLFWEEIFYPVAREKANTPFLGRDCHEPF